MICLCGLLFSSRHAVIHSIFQGNMGILCAGHRQFQMVGGSRDEMAFRPETRDDLALRLASAGRVHSRVLGCEQGHEGLCEAAVGSQGCHRLC